eukprot:1099767-Alexandrium_andersonii.AAC.1
MTQPLTGGQDPRSARWPPFFWCEWDPRTGVHAIRLSATAGSATPRGERGERGSTCLLYTSPSPRD